jgi:hypothetical protein
MNERIQELAKQTGYIWHTSSEPQIYEFTPEKLEKFAELIVRECMNAVCDPRTTYLESMTDSSAMYAAREKIRKHFGG